MASMSVAACSAVDNGFGPHAGDCRGGFDFTLFFEETILTIIPLALLFLVAPPRVLYLLKEPPKLITNKWRFVKLASYITLAVLQVASIVLWLLPSSVGTSASVAAAALGFAGYVLLGLLSYQEHNRSIRPSFILDTYLLFTIIFDTARARTLWLQGYNMSSATLFTIILVMKTIALLLEIREKKGSLRPTFALYPPEALAGVFNRWAFWWENSLFKKGFNNNLGIDDLFTLDDQLSSERLHCRLRAAWQKVPNPVSNTLMKVTFGTFKWQVLAAVPYRIGMIAFSFCQPLLINRVIRLMTEPLNTQTTQLGYGLVGAYIIVYIGIAITTGQHQHLVYRSITMARGGLVSMLYQKATTLSSTSNDPSSSLTLMTADIERITTGWQTMHDLWACVIEITLAIVLLEQQLGVACVIPIGVSIFALFGAGFVTSFVISRQTQWLEAIEKRIGATSAMLASMKGVKMCGLKETLLRRLQELRKEEMRVSKGFRKLLICNMALSYVTPVGAPILTFAVFSVIARNSGGTTTLDTARVFTSLSLFSLLTEPLQSLMQALTTFVGSVGSFARIQEYLLTEEHHDYREKAGDQFDTQSLQGSRKQSSSQRSEFSTRKSLTTEKFDLESMLQDDSQYFAFQDAIVIQQGHFGWDVNEQPMLRNLNVAVPREKFTILIGPVGCGKSTVLKAILGEVPLATGRIQTSSISIAYCGQSPWHMNGTVRESIVGVNARFDEKWYNEVVDACALDEDFRQLPQGDETSIGSNGVALSGGQSQRIALARAVYSQKEIVILDDTFCSLDQDTENKVFHAVLGKYGLLRRRRATVFLASSSVKRLPYADHIVALGRSGCISEQGNLQKLNLNGGYVASFNMSPLENTPTGTRRSLTIRSSATLAKAAHVKEPITNAKDLEAEKARRTGDVSVYFYYIRAIGWLPTLIFVIGIVGFVFCFTFPSVWVKWWALANVEDPNGRLGYWLGIYAVLGLGAIFSLVIATWSMIITMVPKSGVSFHEKLLRTVLNAPMRFFSTTDTGTTLNRFSQDLQLIDMDLPVTALNAFATAVMCIAQMVLIGVASVYAAISFPICLATLYFVQTFYLRTSRQLRYLDLEAKSPLYSAFTECVSGLITIRAYGWQESLERQVRGLLDRSQRPFYMLFAVQRWITLVLDLMVAAVAVILIVIVVNLRGSLSAGNVGVALLNIINFSQYIKILVVFWTMLETNIGAIARIKNFSEDTANENDHGETQQAPPNWPSRGAIEFKNVSASYGGPENVIENVSLSIQPGQKIAVCGRTGSGKSSLMLTLFRMLEQTAGSIVIDGLQVASLPRETLRSRLIGVPQDAYLFPGTVMENVDPSNTASEATVIEALDCVQLWEVISEKGGLTAQIDDCNFSQGQKQLFCLARSMLRPGRIVILDEATSSIDGHTDELIQDVLRTKFAMHTVITVAHKLDSILDFDRIVLMDAGRIVECDAPHTLLAQDSRFAQLYNSSSEQEQ